jgi:hypothetical protein
MDNSTYELLLNDKFIREHFVVLTFDDEGEEVEDDGRLFPKDAPIG